MRKAKRNSKILSIFVLLVGITVGYALLTQDLNIVGSSTVASSSWDIHFDNLEVSNGSVELEEGDSAATIDTTTHTDITYSITLSLPGDFYEFTVDAVNAGSIDGMVDSIISKYNNVEISSSNPIPNYLDYSVTYGDGTEIEEDHLLAAGDSETYKVRVEFKREITNEQLPADLQTLNFSFGITYIQADGSAIEIGSQSLYSVLRDASEVGTYAAKYTGAHQDSWAGNGNKDIYYWTASTNANATAILDKNNVIFAGHCWQMVRTTDTGGVKMIYNGIVDNNQCLNTRGNHSGYGSDTGIGLSTTYYYGTDYTLNTTTNKFSLAGTVSKVAATGPDLVGKYTCRGYTADATCNILYFIQSYSNDDDTVLLEIYPSTADYSSIGRTRFNMTYGSPASVGYMYHSLPSYSVKRKTFYIVSSTYWTLDTTYYYSDTIDYNVTNSQKYTLLNPQPISNLSNYDDLIGKYILPSAGTSDSTARYVVGRWTDSIHYHELKSGDLATSLTFGDSYTESGGVYTLTNPVTVSYVDWYNSTNGVNNVNYRGMYSCPGTNTSCTTIKHLTPTSGSEKSFVYFDNTMSYAYAPSFSYENGTYTLTGDIKTFWDFYETTNNTTLKTRRYTCFGGTSCTTLRYIYHCGSDGKGAIYSFALSGGKNIGDVVNEMFYANDVNTNDSIIKSAIEAWYKRNLLNYDNYLEDTIFCNDRTIRTMGSWNPSSTSLTTTLKFQEYTATTDLSCDRTTDQFSILNPSALLNYKVGLLSLPEATLLNHNYLRSVGQPYWVLSPNYFSSYQAYVNYINTDGSENKNVVNGGTINVRPVISLKPGTTYSSGNGSMASPYVIQ